MKSKTISLGLALAALLAARPASATVTAQGWWHLDTAGNPQDASGNNRNFQSAFSTAPNAGGTFGALVIPNGVGGILDGTGYSSTNCIRLGLGVGARRQSSTWNTGYVPPSTNYGIECWLLPQDNGIAGGTPTWVISTGGGVIGAGPAGGVVIRLFDNGDGTSFLVPGIITGPNSGQVASFGPQVTTDTNQWIHLAIVNDNGLVSFYTNGVLCATNDNSITPPTDSAGVMYIGTDGDNNAYYGFLDELRVFTFNPGEFSTSDLLLPPAGPIIVIQPQNTTVWNGGAASFTVTTPFDFSGGTTFQWITGGTNIPGAVSATLFLPTVTTANSGTNYSVVVTKSSLSVTSSPAILTVVPVQTANVNAYRTAVTGEPSLVAYFPVDNCTGSIVSNVVDSAFDGTLELSATYESRTNRAFGQRAITADADGDVAIPANPAYDFATGNGTVEAIIFMNRATVTDGTIFSLAAGTGQIYYALQANANGNALVFANDQIRLTWTLGSSLIGQRAHIAVVINNSTNVTAYVNGQSLGTLIQPGFGFSPGLSAWIGSLGNPNTFFQDTALFAGAIDEVAVYSSALSENAIQTHYTKYAFGTNTVPPGIVSQPASKTLYAGGSPTLTVVASGSLPISYQWYSNSVPVPGATSPSFTLLNTTIGSTANYSVSLTNAFGGTNGTPFTLTFVNPPAGYVANAMADNPSSYWRLNEAPAAPAAVDFVGLNDATYFPNLTNGLAGVLPGDPDTSTDFGASGRAQVNYTPTLNPSGAWAIEFWANPNTTVGGTAASSQFRVGVARNGFAIYYNALAITGWFIDLGNGAGVFARIISGPPPAPGNWTHIAFSSDGTTGQFYVNGVLQGSASMATYAVNPSAPFTIGRRSDNTTGFNGRLDEVVFYNHALSPSQIATHVTLGGLRATLSINPITIRVMDSQSPSGSPHIGINNGAIRLDSNSDGSTTRNGVMQFISANRHQITVANHTNFDSTVGTIAFWMRTAGTTAGGNEGAMLFDRRDVLGNAFILHDNGRLFVQANPGGANSFESVATLTNNLWRHVAITYDQNVPGDISIYVDGALDSTNPNALPWTWEPRQIEIGVSHDGYWRAYNGLMDDFRIYNRVLTGPEIAQVHSTGAIVDNSALVLRFGFDAFFPGHMITWTPSFPTLQSATSVTGPYLDVTNATYLDIPTVGSPYFAPPLDAQRFFRTRQQ